jgi:hypothetical protein
LNGIYNPPDELKHAAGYRVMPDPPPVQDGYTRVSIIPIEGDGVKGAWEVVDRLTSDIEAEQLAAKMATFPAQKAVIFRLTMRRNFGDGAETNREIDAKAVENFFVSKQVNGTITVQELADASVLERLFAELATWNGTGETWSLPWGVLP